MPDPLRMPGPGAVGAALVACALAASTVGCASPSADIHLAPIVSHLNLAGGADEIDCLAGALRRVRDEPRGPRTQWELHPLVCYDDNGDGSTLTRFLTPFGSSIHKPAESVTKLVPIFRYEEEPDRNGNPSWHLIALPGVVWGEDSTPRTLRGVFPFGGVWEHFASYDRSTFVLFPLFVKNERHGGTFYHFLWPIFGWGRNGRGEVDWHVWPLYGVSRPGNSESHFALWPFFLWSTEHLYLPEDKQVKTWTFWPFYGRKHAGSFDAWTWVWPFFGYSRDRESGFWAWDGPWPFVRILRPGGRNLAYRTRVWPFYSYYEGDGLKSRWLLWPFFNLREETYPEGTKNSENIALIWQHYVVRDPQGKQRIEWQKLWPLYQYKRADDRTRLGFPALLPLMEYPDLDEHYAWIWELYHLETKGSIRQERSWGGIWRREVDERERRTYLSGVWSRRKYRDGGHTVRETSLLFGLLRWRSSKSARFEILRPAFPGPGWPARVGA